MRALMDGSRILGSSRWRGCCANGQAQGRGEEVSLQNFREGNLVILTVVQGRLVFEFCRADQRSPSEQPAELFLNLGWAHKADKIELLCKPR
jgi:hypothetical protein